MSALSGRRTPVRGTARHAFTAPPSPTAEAGQAEPASHGANEAEGANQEGPFASPTLNAALSACFGDLRGLEAATGGRGENDQLGAEAQTSGRSMLFADEPDLDVEEDLDTVAHEVAHALGAGGQAPLDEDGDPGEDEAEHAGETFARWAKGGMKGGAPKLKPAAHGQARVHRKKAARPPPPLRLGASGPRVEALQRRLVVHDEPVRIDGDFGAKTEAAVKRFQRKRGLDVDGVAGPATWAALQRDPPRPANPGRPQPGAPEPAPAIGGDPPLKLGSRGPRVVLLQRRLALTADGDFGPRTEAAVVRFQRGHGLVADGVVGPATARALEGRPGTPEPEKPKPKPGAEDPWNLLDGRPVVNLGDKGTQVRLIQKIFKMRESGTYDRATLKKVKNFQYHHGLHADGTVGPITATFLKKNKDTAANVKVAADNKGKAIKLVKRQNEWMLPSVAGAFDRLADRARRARVNLKIRDGYRPYEEQVDIAEELGIYGQGGWAAVPGTSNHGYGRALDLDDGRSYRWLKDNAGRAGFVQPMRDEPWHWEYWR